MTTELNDLLDKLSVECVEELINATAKEGGPRWPDIVRWKMERLLEQAEELRMRMELSA